MLLTMALQEASEPWEVPGEYRKMENPVRDKDEAMKDGKMLYARHCTPCHGKKGLGDGVMARRLENFNVDFSGEQYQSQTDGEHFYKILTGRGTMPGYEKEMPEEDIWFVVTYIRSLKKD